MRVYQVLDALDYGDGVSNDVINIQKLLNEMNIENEIYSKWADNRVEKHRLDIDKFQPCEDDIILYHFSGYSYIMDELLEKGRKPVLIYHNITPPEYFESVNQDSYEHCNKGIQQLRNHIASFKHFACVSEFNKNDLLCLGVKEAHVLPNALDLDGLMHVNANPDISSSYRKYRMILSVGRIVPNKKYEDIFDIFEEYYSYIDSRSVLLCVGNQEHSPSYMEDLTRKLQGLNCRENVVFTGKISNEDLYGYYKRADAFLCMSEHEGFCMPLLEAMIFEIPVITYNSCAVPFTMGGSGILVNKKDPRMLSEVLYLAIHDESLRDEIIRSQMNNAELYMNENLKTKLRKLLDKWGD